MIIKGQPFNPENPPACLVQVFDGDFYVTNWPWQQGNILPYLRLYAARMRDAHNRKSTSIYIVRLKAWKTLDTNSK
jgi:hypothetical protein